METKKDNHIALKKALEARTGHGLPSNFNYRMMNRIRLEAERQRKRRRFISWMSLILGALSLLGIGLYVVVDYMEFNLTHHLPEIEKLPFDELAAFYWYIASLVFILLGFDYWMRKRRRKTTHE
ncbi:hypothetical protein [Bacteroides sp. 51]|uniref:hypothetical protein n=1 Tax=Bacteroides sp. 51 TaxID=2302938 RepID=UPI0013D3CFC4|nr:hypothetical protein [Bacteroides sp. 51]NDV82761.1 hypothetical protein [Bacteroides sp. 51]